MIHFKLVAESRCDVCGEWKATDWVDADVMSIHAFQSQTLRQLSEGGWKKRLAKEDGESDVIICPKCAESGGAQPPLIDPIKCPACGHEADSDNYDCGGANDYRCLWCNACGAHFDSVTLRLVPVCGEESRLF